MRRPVPWLFVDVDDTLVLWGENGPHPYGKGRGPKWGPNDALIEFVKRYAALHPEALVIVWSGGGQAYADSWGKMLLSDVAYRAFDKSWSMFSMVAENDILIDDLELGIPGRHFSPKNPPWEEAGMQRPG